MGVFDEDSRIEVSTIINLWVSEGFIKPKKKKNLLAVEREYLEELVDRNLLLAHEELASRWSLVELGSVGIRKMCKIHDLVRHVSLIEAQRQRIYYVYSKQNLSSHRRHIVIPKMITRGDHGLKLESSPHPRSYICHDDYVWRYPDFRLLRILHTPFSTDDASRYHVYRQDDVFRLVNSRLLTITANSVLRNDDYVLLSLINRLWSLHTLIVYHSSNLEGPVEFWNMHQLKHVEFASGRLRLQPPPTNNDVIMENLHTLIGIKDFHLNEDVVRRIPNLTILDVSYGKKINNEVHSLSYLQRFSKLEGFRCSITKKSGQNLLRICFPRSLKQIILLDDFYSRHIQWEDVLQKIGELHLPFLEELAIKGGFFRSGEWETIEGQFPRLKSLQLDNCRGLEYWTVSEASHFPLLQNLILLQMEELEEIPSNIGEIATLKSIGLSLCSESAVLSAKKIVEEQDDLYGVEELSFHVLAVVENEELESLID